jgi:hypothetical protein
MFCPKCAEQNLDDAKFCRSCGANVSLVAQALTSGLQLDINADREKQASGVMYTIISLGLAALAIVILFLAPPQDGWAIFFATMIAACVMFGVAVRNFVSAQHHERPFNLNANKRTAELKAQEGAAGGELPPARDTASMVTPASVTESTTRNLVAEAVPRRARRMSGES